ncbi:MAG: iron-sulfur cluster assembly accessory protein [Planctomycetota bacterium]
MITLTERAAKEVVKIREEQSLPETAGLRLSVKSGGCSGFEYLIDFAQEAGEGDNIFESNGVPVYVDKTSLLYLVNTTVDFEESLTRRGFLFNNPNASGTCGCGISFDV